MRRDALKIAAALPAASLPRFAIAQVDARPTITIAVQRISNSNTFDLMREQSNVGERTSLMFTERLIDLDYRGNLAQVPSLATEWRRIDDATVELKLRQGVKFHNGDDFTAEDVAFSFGPEHMFGDTRPVVNGKTLPVAYSAIIGQGSKKLPDEISPVARRLWPGLDRVDIVDKYTVRFVNAVPDVTIEGKLSALGSEIVSPRAFHAAPSLAGLRAPSGRHGAVCDPRVQSGHGTDPGRARRLLGRPAADQDDPPGRGPRGRIAHRRPAFRRISFRLRHPARSDRDGGEEHAFEVVGGTILNHRITTFDIHHPQLRDPRVRLALAHAIDRKAIIDSLWFGRTKVPPGMQWEFFGEMVHRRFRAAAIRPRQGAPVAEGRRLQKRSDPGTDCSTTTTPTRWRTRRSWWRCGGRSG